MDENHDSDDGNHDSKHDDPPEDEPATPDDEPEDASDDFEGMQDEMDAAIDPLNLRSQPDDGDPEDWASWRKDYDEHMKTLQNRLDGFRIRGYENVHYSELRTMLETQEWMAANPEDQYADNMARIEQAGLQDADDEIDRDGAADFQAELADIAFDGEDHAMVAAAMNGAVIQPEDEPSNPFQDEVASQIEEINIDMELLFNNQEPPNLFQQEIDEILHGEGIDDIEALLHAAVDDALEQHDPARALDIVAAEAELDVDLDDLDVLQDLDDPPSEESAESGDLMDPEERRRYWRRAAGILLPIAVGKPLTGAVGEPQTHGTSAVTAEFDFGRHPLIDGEWNKSTYVSTLIATGFKPQIDVSKRGKAPPILELSTSRKKAYISALIHADALAKGRCTFAAPHHWREVGDKLRLIFNGKQHGEATKRPPPHFHMHSHKHIRRMAAKHSFAAKFD